jgi:hypothetical protein
VAKAVTHARRNGGASTSTTHARGSNPNGIIAMPIMCIVPRGTATAEPTVARTQPRGKCARPQTHASRSTTTAPHRGQARHAFASQLLKTISTPCRHMLEHAGGNERDHRAYPCFCRFKGCPAQRTDRHRTEVRACCTQEIAAIIIIQKQQVAYDRVPDVRSGASREEAGGVLFFGAPRPFFHQTILSMFSKSSSVRRALSSAAASCCAVSWMLVGSFA